MPGISCILAQEMHSAGIHETRSPYEPGILDCSWIEPEGRRMFYHTVGQDALQALPVWTQYGIRYAKIVLCILYNLVCTMAKLHKCNRRCL